MTRSPMRKSATAELVSTTSPRLQGRELREKGSAPRMRQSRKVHEEVGDKLALGYENLGEQTVKNIAKPVRVFRVLTEGGAATRITTKYPPGAAVRVRLSPGRASAPRRYSVPDTAISRRTLGCNRVPRASCGTFQLSPSKVSTLASKSRTSCSASASRPGTNVIWRRISS